jgi:hypothetical protein
VPRTSAKNAAALSVDGARRLDGVGPLELRPTGHPEGSVDINLTGLLCRLLALPDKEGKTWAQQVAEVWIDNAVTGEISGWTIPKIPSTLTKTWSTPFAAG